jgi:hypothetical protein
MTESRTIFLAEGLEQFALGDWPLEQASRQKPMDDIGRRVRLAFLTSYTYETR